MNISVLIELMKNAYAHSVTQHYTIIKKGTSDYVTSVDIAVEKYLIEHLSKLYPEYGFLSEETSFAKSEKYWLIDPIDGTTNFIHGLNHTITLALIESDIMHIGIVYEPLANTVYYAEKGKGAYKITNDQTRKIKLDETTKTENIMLSFGMPYDKNKLNKIFDYANKAMQKADDIKRIGPASKDICMVAEGLIDCYFELDLKPWDIQAASLILNEAGGFYKKIDDLYIAYTPSVAKWVEELEFLNERI